MIKEEMWKDIPNYEGYTRTFLNIACKQIEKGLAIEVTEENNPYKK